MCLAIPGQVLEVTGDEPITRFGKVSFGGVMRDVSLAHTPEAKVGDYVIVHVGFALSVLDEQEASELLHDLDEAGITVDGRPAGH